VGILGSLFVLRGFGYAMSAPDWTSWVNPLGWMTETRPANGNNWWPLWFAFAFVTVLLAIAVVLQSRRDFGVGTLAPRPGPARGNIRSTTRLALRLNRSPIITWAIAFIALGVVYGYFVTSINDILGSDSAVKQLLAVGASTPDALVSAFVATVVSLVGIIAAVPGVHIMLKLRTEEMENRIEPLVATKVPRQGLYASNVVLALVTTAIYVLLAGAIIAALASTADIGVNFGNVLLQAVVTIPAVWTVVAVSIAVIGAHPQVSLAAWVGVLASFTLTLLGPTFKLWDWILAISPFWHVPNVTSESADWWGLLWIGLVTIVFLVIGFTGFRRRDLAR
jgi:ABC-2 type transport system permease protein